MFLKTLNFSRFCQDENVLAVGYCIIFTALSLNNLLTLVDCWFQGEIVLIVGP